MRMSAAAIRGGAIAAIAVAVFGAASATPWIVSLALPSYDRSPPLPSMPTMTVQPFQPVRRDPALAQTMESVVATVLAAVVVALVGIGLYWLIRRLRAAWVPEEPQVEPDALAGGAAGETLIVDIASLATAVARANARLGSAGEPGDAVIAAWVALEQEAEWQGTGRDPAQTATEFTARLLERTPAPADAVALLRGLYHRARFTPHPVGPDDVRQAREALGRIAEALDAAVPAEPDRTQGRS